MTKTAPIVGAWRELSWSFAARTLLRKVYAPRAVGSIALVAYHSARMRTKLHLLLPGISFTIAACCALFPVRAADEANLLSQFQYVSGEPPLGDTALHTNWKLVWQDDFS